MFNLIRACLAKLVQALLISVFIFGSIVTYAGEAITLAESMKGGDTVSGALKYGHRVIALPTGKWRLISWSERDASTENKGALMGYASFDEIIDGRLNRLLAITATKFSKNINWIDEPCKNKGDSYWIEDRKRSINDQFCIRVGFLSGVVDNARGEAFQTWARSILKDGVKYSPEIPFILVTKYSAHDFLSMQIGINPDVYGIPKSSRPERQFNDWNANVLSEQPQRLKFFEALKNWASAYSAAVARAFDGDSTLSSKDYGELSIVQSK